MYYTTHTTAIDMYLNEIRSFKSLSIDDETNLFDRYAKGDSKAVDEIFNRVAKFALSVAKLYTGDPYLLEELIEQSNLGVLMAIPRYDITKGFRFISFAVYYMKVYINNYLFDNKYLVQITKSRTLAPKVKKIREDFFKKNYREPSEFEIYDILETQGEVVTDMSYLHELAISSINTPYGDGSDDETCPEDNGEFAVRTSNEMECVQKFENEELHNQVASKMEMLTDREKNFITLAYGLDGNTPMSFENIAIREGERLSALKGKKVEFSRERVRQIVNGAIKKMRG